MEIHLNSPFPTKKNSHGVPKDSIDTTLISSGRFCHAAARVEKQDESLGAGEAEKLEAGDDTFDGQQFG